MHARSRRYNSGRDENLASPPPRQIELETSRTGRATGLRRSISPSGRKTCSPASRFACGDMPAPINRAASLPPASGSGLHHAIYRIAGSPPRACRRCRQRNAKSPDFAIPKSGDCGLRSDFIVYRARPELWLECTRRIPPHGRRSVFHNPRAELRCECQCDQEEDRRSAFDISSPAQTRRCTA